MESCKSSFMSMIKEADFVRYGSTKKVSNLRRQEQDSLWDGLVERKFTSLMVEGDEIKLARFYADDFEKYWSVASKLIPAPSPPSLLHSRQPSRTPSMVGPIDGLTRHANESQTSVAASVSSDHESNGGSGGNRPPTSAVAPRNVPIRFHLPDQAPIVQEPIAPLEDGRPVTLQSTLSSLFPLLFPPPQSFKLGSASAPNLAVPIIHGVQVPLESEIGWLSSAFTSADGWLSIVLIV